MSKLKIAFAASVLLGLSSASVLAMPISNLATDNVGVKAEHVRWVCNPWGRCWWRPNYYGAYAYYGPRPYWRWHRHHRWHRW
jgi:hypothetical protein